MRATPLTHTHTITQPTFLSTRIWLVDERETHQTPLPPSLPGFHLRYPSGYHLLAKRHLHSNSQDTKKTTSIPPHSYFLV